LFELRREKLRRKSVRVSAPQRRPAALPLILITVVLEMLPRDVGRAGAAEADRRHVHADTAPPAELYGLFPTLVLSALSDRNGPAP